MSVMVTADQPGMTQEMYDGLAAELLPLLREREGFIAHAAWPVDGGFKVMEMWESESQHDAWANDVVLPRMPQGAPPLQLSVQPLRSALIGQAEVVAQQNA
jgi:hypothetical protein